MNQNNNRCWNVLTWNVRGINASWKWDAIKNKVIQSGCDVVCLQETKKEVFDQSFLRNICPAGFDSFGFLPSVGASGGILVVWKSAIFSGSSLFSNSFSISFEFISLLDGSQWFLTCVYGPCAPEGKVLFIDWMKNIQMPDEVDWIILGDFNLIRKPEDRNKPGGSMTEMHMFNEAISLLGLNEIVLQGRKYTWSNMQPSPLLEKLDWFFTSASWNLTYPNTSAKALDMMPSDHTPCLISFSTAIPKSKVFRFENYWLLSDEFLDVVNNSWQVPNHHVDKAKSLTAKLKLLRKNLREWHASKVSLKTLIANCRIVIQFLEVLSDYRDLSIEEFNFKSLLCSHLLELLEKQRIYWKQRGAVKWVKFGDASTKFFHANATARYQGNKIAELVKKTVFLSLIILEKSRSCGKTSRSGLAPLNLKNSMPTLLPSFRGLTIFSSLRSLSIKRKLTTLLKLYPMTSPLGLMVSAMNLSKNAGQLLSKTSMIYVMISGMIQSVLIVSIPLISPSSLRWMVQDMSLSSGPFHCSTPLSSLLPRFWQTDYNQSLPS